MEVFMDPQKDNRASPELIAQVRERARSILAACDEAEVGKIGAEEFEKRITKSTPGHFRGMNPKANF